MNARRFILTLVVAVITLGTAHEASAYYAAHIGRFTSRDPAGEVERFGGEMPADSEMETGFVDRNHFDPMAEYDDGMNLYQYVQSDPVHYVDPQGLARDSVSASIEKCLQLPFPANVKCLENLLGSGFKDDAIRVLQCQLVYKAYKAVGAKCRACVPTMTKKELLANAACFSAEVAGRARYMSMNCDCVLPGSIAAGSAKKKRTHQIELANKSAAASTCYALAARAKK